MVNEPIKICRSGVTEQRRVPGVVIRPDGFIDLADEVVTRLDVVVRMMIGRDNRAVVEVGRLYKRILRQAILFAVVLEVSPEAEIVALYRSRDPDLLPVVKGLPLTD